MEYTFREVINQIWDDSNKRFYSPNDQLELMAGTNGEILCYDHLDSVKGVAKLSGFLYNMTFIELNPLIEVNFTDILEAMGSGEYQVFTAFVEGTRVAVVNGDDIDYELPLRYIRDGIWYEGNVSQDEYSILKDGVEKSY